MNGAPSGLGNSGVGPEAEDLDGVLGRFQDWAKARRDQPPGSYGTTAGIGGGTATRKANLATGAREFSYEQALRASSYRRLVYPETAETETLPLVKPQPAESPLVELPQLGARPNADDSTGDTTKPAPVAPPKAVEAADWVVSSSLESIASLAPAISELDQPQSLAPARKPDVTQPAFCQVLRQTADFAAALRGGAIPESKSIVLSLRVSDAERARIRACAARANLSVSAYLRQCALGVDELRNQVELALGELQRQRTKSETPSLLSAIPDNLGRFATRVFRRLRGNHDYTSIPLS